MSVPEELKAGGAPRVEGRFVLLVEDNALVARTLHAILEDGGLPTRCLADGESAWELLASERGRAVGAVVCDLGLPGISGRELLSRISAEFPRLPVVVVSGYSEPSLHQELLAAGARGVITKPIDPAELTAAVAKFFRLS